MTNKMLREKLEQLKQQCEFSLLEFNKRKAISTKRDEQRFYAKRIKLVTKKLYHVAQLLELLDK